MSDVPSPAAVADPFDFARTVGMLSVAWVGTGIAGGFFPVVIVIAAKAVSLMTGSPDKMADVAGFIVVGGIVGSMLAITIGLILASVALLIAWLCSLPAGAVWFESLVGGWAGFFTTHLLLDVLQETDSHLLIGLAVVTGQLGAGGAVLTARRLSGFSGRESPEGRVGLRQLFGLTTAIAVLAAIGSRIEVDSLVYSTLWLAAAIQSSLIALWYFWSAMREKYRELRLRFT